MLGFLGPNGAGKTTTMRAIFGLVEPDSGEVRWDGRPVRLQDRLRFGYMPEERGLYPRMPVDQQLAYFGRLYGRTQTRRARRGGVAGAARPRRAGDGEAGGLSHGNQQRAQLAAALVHEPELLVLDEPFAGLDPLAVHTMSPAAPTWRPRGTAVLFSSHQLDLVENLCEDVAIIDYGRIVATGNLIALRRRSQHRQIELRLDGAPPQWLPTLTVSAGGTSQRQPAACCSECNVDPELVLAEAERTAQVVGFSYGPPSLTELFLGWWSDERPAGDHTRCLARNPRAPAPPRLPRLDAADAGAGRRLERAEPGAVDRDDVQGRGCPRRCRRDWTPARCNGRRHRRPVKPPQLSHSAAAGRRAGELEESRRASLLLANEPPRLPQRCRHSGGRRQRTRPCGRCDITCRPHPS